MTQVEHLATFVGRSSYDILSDAVRSQLKIRVLDSLGCAIGAVDGEPIQLIRTLIDDFGGARHCTMIGGGQTSPDRAAFYNSALVRYLDFNDSYLAKGETCHPSDNLGAILAAAEYANQSGREFMTALAVAYQVQCRLSDVAPVRAKGFDHTTQGAYAVTAGISRALGLDASKTANALAISGTAFNALRVTRTGALSHWKGLAYPNTAFGCTHATFLAMRGITGPLEIFEGNKGFMDTIAGRFEIDWIQEDLGRVTSTVLKKYNAEIHSQSAIEGILELKRDCGFTAAEVTRIEIEIFDVAYHIIGGGEEGNKTMVRTKEEADHSLPYLIAVAVLDGRVMPEQYKPDRIRSHDVQELLKKILVKPSEAFSLRFPAEIPCRITVSLSDCRVLIKGKKDYEGFRTNPMQWETVVQKFEKLSGPYTDRSLRLKIVDAVADLDSIQISCLLGLLAKVQIPAT
ncbi:MAG: MmgE/PrpD family protein [Candidatus Brocadia sp.]|nr:MmgE/PrpD family protein [Candidatus Brocadia sp.]MDG6027248.1 MmgE/PrpD family protein [Candidatus Brocadia sp.]